KPRPAVIVQSDWLIATESVLVALVTSALVNAPLYRLTIEPNETNGLKAPSQVMIDKIVAIPREKCGKVVGRLNESERIALDHMLAVVVGIAD
ncbi:MAG: type II toxin-antitoxin system PemK/MazF family toxin, partial [Hyphomicrobiales bacterium]|nr:type II toxin-antitoxin system PemK/MazF family toxin [Hyphomicrobiales bacterium]